MTHAEIAQLIEQYRGGMGLIERALERVTDDNLDRSDEGGWTPRMVIHHLADSETNSYVRLRRLLAEPRGTMILGYDEDRWSHTPALGYATYPIADSLAVLRAVRAASANVLEHMTAEDFEREGVHTQTGRYTVRDWLEIYVRHAHEHAEQILRACGEQKETDD